MSRAQDVLARMKGPVVPLNLCFNVDGTPDYPSIARYVDWLADEGVPILMLTAGSSEFASLSDDEIWRLTAVVAEANQGRALFIASSGLWKPSVTREFLVHADRVGADAVKLQFSSWLTLRRDVLVRYFDLVQDAADVPLLLLSGGNFPIDGAIELASRPNMVGIKNDGHPFYDYYELLRGTADQDFGVISGGQMRNFMFGHPLGSPAYLCPIAPIRPGLANEFYAHVAAGRTSEPGTSSSSTKTRGSYGPRARTGWRRSKRRSISRGSTPTTCWDTPIQRRPQRSSTTCEPSSPRCSAARRSSSKPLSL